MEKYQNVGTLEPGACLNEPHYNRLPITKTIYKHDYSDIDRADLAAHRKMRNL